jgi:hypothetical protein
MKTLIKNYKTPLVNRNVLQNALLIHWQKESKVKILSHMFLIVIFLIFIQNLVQFNLSNIDIFVSVIGNINIVLIIFINLLVWMTYFIFQNPLLIVWTFFLYYVSRMHYYSKVAY